MSEFPTLLPYGWGGQPLPTGTTPARVIRHDGSTLSVITEDGVRGTRNSTQLHPAPTVGDWLALNAGAGSSAGPSSGSSAEQIHSVLPRTSLLRRQSADESGEQALAANVDVVLITCGIDRPIKAGRLHRSIAICWDAGATPVIVLTKASGADASAIDIPQLQLEHPGVPVLVTSALEGQGLDAVRSIVAGRTAVLLGESGAGKSTLANALLQDAEAIITGQVRAGDAKGRHTTTARQLHLLPQESGGGVIIDTPGIRSIGLFTDADAVDASFAEILELASDCRFRDCTHGTEPGCAVLVALELGALNRKRYDAWRQLQREVARAALRSSPHEERRRGKQFSRAAKLGAARKRGGPDGW